MKKRVLWLLTAVLLLLWGAASAAWPTPVKVDYMFYVGEGETVYPDFPDLAYLIDEDLTIDDFDVRYDVDLYAPKSWGFNGDGSYTESQTGTIPRTFAFYMFYTPKDGVNAKETVFQGKISVYKPLKSLSILPKDVVMSIDETAELAAAAQRVSYSGAKGLSGHFPSSGSGTFPDPAESGRPAYAPPARA